MRNLKLLTILLVASTLSCCVLPPLPRPQAHFAIVLTVTDGRPSSIGSAFVAHSGKGYSLLVTARHVVHGETFVGVVKHDTPVGALVVVTDPKTDLAILLVPLQWPAATIAPQPPTQGTPVLGLGPTPAFGNAITHGFIASQPGPCSEKDNLNSCILADLPIGPGFSGSPVVDQYGQVVGVVSAYSRARPHWAFLIGTKAIHALLAKAVASIKANPDEHL